MEHGEGLGVIGDMIVFLHEEGVAGGYLGDPAPARAAAMEERMWEKGRERGKR